MRLAFTSDLHYGADSSDDALVAELARRLESLDVDALAIAGDVAIADPRALVECLRMFESVAPVRMAVPGNHDLWSRPGGADSLTICDDTFPRALDIAGFHSLDSAPLTVNGLAFVGSVGWYDYSFAVEKTERGTRIPRSFHVEKRVGGRVVWNDAEHIRWDHDDESFTERCREGLAEQLDQVRASGRKIVSVVHHVPFVELVDEGGPPLLLRGFLGSSALGEVIGAEKDVILSISGHMHIPVRMEIGHIENVIIGSRHGSKRAVVYEMDDGIPRLITAFQIPGK